MYFKHVHVYSSLLTKPYRVHYQQELSTGGSTNHVNRSPKLKFKCTKTVKTIVTQHGHRLVGAVKLEVSKEQLDPQLRKFEENNKVKSRPLTVLPSRVLNVNHVAVNSAAM